jgi:hypothetical protein
MVGLGGRAENSGEATVERMLQTTTETVHNMQTLSPLIPSSPVNIISAGEQFALGYGALHNISGTVTFNTGESVTVRADEHYVVTPDHQLIRLHKHPNRPRLLYLVPMQPSTAQDTDHLKEVDRKYIGMLKQESNIQFDVSPHTYATSVQNAVSTVEKLARQLAHLGAYDHTAGELLIAMVSAVHEVQNHLNDTDPEAHKEEQVRRIIDNIPSSALSEVCTRCESIGCNSKVCIRACHTCGEVEIGKHTEGCIKAEHANTTIYTLSDRAKDMIQTGAGEDEDTTADDHAALHAKCDENPCETCMQHEQLTAAVGTAEGCTDHDIVAAFESLQVNKDVKARNNNPTQICVKCKLHTLMCVCEKNSPALITNKLTAGGVCKMCKKHWTGCKCKPKVTPPYKPSNRKLPVATPVPVTSTSNDATNTCDDPLNSIRNTISSTSTSTSMRNIASASDTIPIYNIIEKQSSDIPIHNTQSPVRNTHLTHDGNTHPSERNTHLDQDGNTHPSVRNTHLTTDGNTHPSERNTHLDQDGNTHPSEGNIQPSTSTEIQRASMQTMNSNVPLAPQTGTKRQQPTPSLQEMAALVEEHAWACVLDEADTLPDVLHYDAREWLQVVPYHERCMLAVATQNVNENQLSHDKAVTEHGEDSQTTEQRRQWLSQAQNQKSKAVDRAAMAAKAILSAATTIEDDE